MPRRNLTPTTPGEVLLEEFLKPLEISQDQLAKDVGVPPRRINEIVLGKRSVTADTALRLARYFSTSERFWLNLQARHDLETERPTLAEAEGCCYCIVDESGETTATPLTASWRSIYRSPWRGPCSKPPPSFT
jgi:addiction module HigA family antidote